MRTSTLKYNSGDKYGNLMLTGKALIRGAGQLYTEAICNCGMIKFMCFNKIKSGISKSCGCERTKHGLIGHPIYSTWLSMKSRCVSERSKKYYKNKGISVCDEWNKNFKSFFEWSISNGWEKGLTIDRIKNDLGYCESNCRWATPAEQNRNISSNVILYAFGETKCLTDWVKDDRCVVAFNAVRLRMKNLKWDAEKALSTPNLNNEENRVQKGNSGKVVYRNQQKSLSEWCRILGVNLHTIKTRVRNGWEIEKAFETPIKKEYANKTKIK